jgi:hypothetical protein
MTQGYSWVRYRTINQALVVLGGYAFVLAGKLEGEW